MARWTEQFTADTIGVTRHQVRNRLNRAYEALIQALSTENQQHTNHAIDGGDCKSLNGG